MSVSKIFEVLYWAWIGSEILFQLVMRTSRSSGKLRDRGSIMLMLPVIFASVWAAFWYGDTHSHTMLGGADWLKSVALVLLAAGLAIRWGAVLTLGLSFSTNVAIHATQKLRRTGLFHWVRHPSYSGMLLIFAAMGIMERNWGSLAIVLVFPTAVLLYRIHVEEMALREAFGDDYVEYSKVTKRLAPGIY
jgi:protein-S-isoprenylcysteine O-methyltransferase Ste14